MRAHKQDGLVTRLDHLQRQIDELSRRSGGHGAEIATVEVGEPSEIEFTDIPRWYRHLHLVISGGQTGSKQNGIWCQFNGAGSGYDMAYSAVIGSSVVSNRHNSASHIELGAVGPSTWTSSAVATAVIGNYAADAPTHCTAQCAYTADVGDLRIWSGAGWHFQRPYLKVDRLRLYVPNALFSSGTVASLYGLR